MRKRRAQGLLDMRPALSYGFSYTHLEAGSDSDRIICPTCLQIMQEKPCYGWLISGLNA